MKRSLIVVAIMLLFLNHNGYSQETTANSIMINEKTLIKDESGNKVEILKLMDLMKSGEWTMDPVKDKQGSLLYMQLRKMTKNEKKEMLYTPSPLNNSDIIGKQVPDFIMTDLNGNEISSKNTKGKVVVLNFWFVSCKPCIAEIPELNEVYETYKNNSEVVFASITFDKKEKVDAFLEKYALQYPVVSDALEICKLFKISGYPTNIVIDKNGNFYDSISGGFDQIGHQISKSIQNALAGK